MAFRLPNIANKKSLHRTLTGVKESVSKPTKIPKGHFGVYVGESQKKRSILPLSYLNEPLFQDLLRISEEEFGYTHQMGGLTITCSEAVFVDLISQLN